MKVRSREFMLKHRPLSSGSLRPGAHLLEHNLLCVLGFFSPQACHAGSWSLSVFTIGSTPPLSPVWFCVTWGPPQQAPSPRLSERLIQPVGTMVGDQPSRRKGKAPGVPSLCFLGVPARGCTLSVVLASVRQGCRGSHFPELREPHLLPLCLQPSVVTAPRVTHLWLCP